MFSSNFTKFFAFSVLSLLLFSSCRFASNTPDAKSSALPTVADDLKSEVPFSTKEPEQFQAEMVVTAGGTERRTFIARKGAARRYDFNFGAKNQVTALHTDKNYLLSPALGIYAETAGAQALTTDDWTSFLTTEWLNEKTRASFEKLETVGKLTKYRVLLGDSPSSEVFVYVDETFGLPVKQEFYSTGEPKTLTYTFELKNLKFQTDENLFLVPAEFKRVSTEEFWKIVRGRKD